MGGFGTDPQMTAVPSIASSVCVHLKGSRRNYPLHPGLPPCTLPCPYWLHTNCVAYMKYRQVSAPGWCSERSPVRLHSAQPLAMIQCIQVSTVGIIDFVRLPNSLWAGLVFMPSMGVLRRLSRSIYGSSPELSLFLSILFAIFTAASAARFA